VEHFIPKRIRVVPRVVQSGHQHTFIEYNLFSP